MENYIIYITMFILIYLVYLLFILIRPKQLEKFKSSSYVTILVKKYHIDLKKINFKVLAHMVCLGNAFILSTVVFVISWLENVFLIMIVGLLVMLILTLAVYHLIGIMYRKKEK